MVTGSMGSLNVIVMRMSRRTSSSFAAGWVRMTSGGVSSIVESSVVNDQVYASAIALAARSVAPVVTDAV